MKTIGLLGGMTWHSTATYYDRINRGIAERLGPFRSARLVLHSIDYGSIRRARDDGDWRRLERELLAAGRGLANAGADGLFLCSNTIHRFAPSLEAQLPIPVHHIADALAARMKRDGHSTIGVLATAFTASQSFYRLRLEQQGLRVQVNEPSTLAALDHIILEELASGTIRAESRERFQSAMEDLAAAGATVIALACTEIGMLVKPEHSPLPMVDTTIVHADHAVAWALDD